MVTCHFLYFRFTIMAFYDFIFFFIIIKNLLKILLACNSFMCFFCTIKTCFLATSTF